MAEDKFEPREINYRQWLPWTQLFRGFWVAVDPKKLLLAAAGILVMAFGWWLLATIFFSINPKPPGWPSDYPSANYQSKDGSDEDTSDKEAFNAFKKDRDRWNLLYAAAGAGRYTIGPGDLGESPEEVKLLQKVANKETGAEAKAESFIISPEEAIRIQSLLPKGAPKVEPGGKKRFYLGSEKRHAELRTWPWFEDRGPNPFLLVTGQAGTWERRKHADSAAALEKGETGEAVTRDRGFWDWLLRNQIPVLIEPLVKFFRPIGYLLSPYKGFLEGLYFLLVIAWTVATWAIFGGAITRMAAVEIARNDKLGLGEALRFVLARWRSYVFAPFAPLITLAGCAVLLMVFFGIPNWIPIFAEFWVGLLLPLALGLGLFMAIVLIGLPGWPMIHATLGAEGSDSFDALSRSYSYVLQKPWSYIWYALVALVYGAIVVFFVGLMGSLMVYLAKWSISQTPLNETFNRDPSYLFMWAPTSFDWRALLVQGGPVSAVGDTPIPPTRWWNNIYVGPFCVAIWLGLVFLMIVGFGYSYFWSASTIIYLMMRRKVDDTELDEVYLEEEEPDETYTAPAAPTTPATQSTAGATAGLQMVEAPSLLRTTAPATPSSPSASPVTEETAANPGDGDIPA